MAKLEVEIKLDTEALVRELKEAAEKIEAEKESGNRPDRWIFDRCDMTCSKCRTTFSDELMCMNRDDPIGDWLPVFCPECGAKLRHDKEASE